MEIKCILRQLSVSFRSGKFLLASLALTAIIGTSYAGNYVTTNGLTATYPPLPANPSGTTTNIRLSQFEGAGATPGANSGAAVVPLTSVTWNAITNAWEVTFNVTGFSTFYLHTNLTSTPLPVNFVSFRASANGQSNQLTWTMANNAQGMFEILHSNDGDNFESISKLAAKGSPVYSFEHTAPQSLEIYQIRFTDKDGKAYYSGTQMVQRVGNTGLAVMLYPNPATRKTITVNVWHAEKADAAYSITDVLGKEVLKGILPTLGNSNTTASIDITALGNGIYNFKLLSGNDWVVRRMVIANRLCIKH
jgi:hypothetical protein